MKTLTLENINESDLDIFVALAKRLNIEAKVSEATLNENQQTDCINPDTGEYLSVGEFQKAVLRAEEEEGISKKDFLNHMNEWRKKLIA
jgi:hypothetical protein